MWQATPDMLLLQAHVLAAETSDLVMVATGVSANTDRRAFAYEGRLKATKKLYELGMPRKAISQLLGVGESTVDRDLALAGDDEMMAYVHTRCIQATNAASLLAAAGKRRVAGMPSCRTSRRMRFGDQGSDRRGHRYPQGSGCGTVCACDKTWRQSRLAAGLVKRWRAALEKGQDLTDPGFRFKALVRSDGGVQRIEVDALNKTVDDMSAKHRQGAPTLCGLGRQTGAGPHQKMAEESQESESDETGRRPVQVGTAAGGAGLGPTRQRAGRRFGTGRA